MNSRPMLGFFNFFNSGPKLSKICLKPWPLLLQPTYFSYALWGPTSNRLTTNTYAVMMSLFEAFSL